MNCENSKTSERYRLLLNLADKINLKRTDKHVALSTLIMYYRWVNVRKSLEKAIDSKYQLQHGMRNLIYVIDHILYEILKIILNIF